MLNISCAELRLPPQEWETARELKPQAMGPELVLPTGEPGTLPSALVTSGLGAKCPHRTGDRALCTKQRAVAEMLLRTKTPQRVVPSIKR